MQRNGIQYLKSNHTKSKELVKNNAQTAKVSIKIIKLKFIFNHDPVTMKKITVCRNW